MRSSRLPNKVMLPILGRPMLELMIERLRRVPQINDIVIATTAHESCEPIVQLAEQVGVGCYRGSEDDVLDRVLQAARSVNADLIVETTADCPVIDPAVITKVIQTFKQHDIDYCANILERTYPRGMDVQVFPTNVLAEVAELTDDPADREHVSLYIYKHPERYRLLNVASKLPPEAAALRLTVDTQEDLRLITGIYERLYPAKRDFSLADIIELMEREPALKTINRGVQQKAVP